MKRKSHIWLGAMLGFIFIYFTVWLGYDIFPFNPLSVLIIAGTIVFYSLLPDIDHRGSTITWWFFGIGIFGILIGILGLTTDFIKISSISLLIISALLLSLTFIATNFFEHRGLIHSIPVGILAAIPLYFIFHNIAYCLLAFVAWYSHLAGDRLFFKVK